jgi:acetolactate synthase I/II/III large subunit
MAVTRVADLIFARLADAGLSQAFLVTGGGAMFLNDALRRESRFGWTCHHHEQAAAMAAEGYARISGRPAVLSVTSGPGGINALNGVWGAWTDSIPMVVVSGQVKRETCMSTYPDLRIRQLGDQEADVVPLVAGMTKYATCITLPDDAVHHVDEALYQATHGRQGPVWLDVPIDVQAAEVRDQPLPMFISEVEAQGLGEGDLAGIAKEVLERLDSAGRPVIIAGTGVRLAGAVDAFRRVVSRLGVPVVTAWTHDLLGNDHPLWCGRSGTIGDRAGNFVVQNADLLLVLGSRLNIRQIGYNWRQFAQSAFKIQVDVDPEEMRKPTVRPDLAVAADVRAFLGAVEAEIVRSGGIRERHAEWRAWCRARVDRYPVVLARHRTARPPINPYHFIEILFAQLGDHDVVVTGNGAACVMAFQAGRLREGQRLFSNSGAASMGYDLPAALGAAVALAEAASVGAASRAADSGRSGSRVVCLAGDGSLQMNVQELQTLATHGWPVKVFVLDNGGYLSIRSSQLNFFDGLIGESPASGLGFPDWVALAEAFGLEAVRLENPHFLTEEIATVLSSSGPCLVHVVVDPEQGFEPRTRSRPMPDGTIESPALDDMFPFLPPEELSQNRVGTDGLLP